MKVVELKNILSGFPDEMDIYMSSDAEGNNYHSVDTVSREDTYKDGEYGGESVALIWPMHDNPELF
jgi:hypothetical protein